MKLTAPDLTYLRWTLVTLILTVLIAGASLWAANAVRLAGEKDYRAALAKRIEAQNKLAQVSQEQEELTEKILRFQQVVRQGYTQPENRLDSVELLDRLRKTHRLGDFQYEFSAQQPVEVAILPGGALAGGFNFLSSKQHMTMKILHEGDVWNFLGALKSEAHALIVVRHCTLEKLPPVAADRGSGPYLGADCTLDWITLREHN